MFVPHFASTQCCYCWSIRSLSLAHTSLGSNPRTSIIEPSSFAFLDLVGFLSLRFGVPTSDFSFCRRFALTDSMMAGVSTDYLCLHFFCLRGDIISK